RHAVKKLLDIADEALVCHWPGPAAKSRPGQVEPATQRLGDRPIRFGCSKAYLPVDSDIYTCLGLYLIALVGRQADIDRTVCPRIVRHAYQHLGLQRFPGSQCVGVALEPHVPAAVAGMCCEADLCSFAAAVVYADGSRQALTKGLVGSDLCSSKIQVQFE